MGEYDQTANLFYGDGRNYYRDPFMKSKDDFGKNVVGVDDPGADTRNADQKRSAGMEWLKQNGNTATYDENKWMQAHPDLKYLGFSLKDDPTSSTKFSYFDYQGQKVSEAGIPSQGTHDRTSPQNDGGSNFFGQAAQFITGAGAQVFGAVPMAVDQFARSGDMKDIRDNTINSPGVKLGASELWYGLNGGFSKDFVSNGGVDLISNPKKLITPGQSVSGDIGGSLVEWANTINPANNPKGGTAITGDAPAPSGPTTKAPSNPSNPGPSSLASQGEKRQNAFGDPNDSRTTILTSPLGIIGNASKRRTLLGM